MHIQKCWGYLLFASGLLGMSEPLAGQTKCAGDTALLTFLHANGRSPDAYLLEKFKRADVVLLGEDHHVKQNLLFVQDLISALYRAGVYAIGMEFGAAEDQAALDALVNAPEYDTAMARRIMFHYNVAWAFQEYMDVYRKAWAFNKTLPKGSRRFRILNLSYVYNWEGFAGRRTPENMAQVFYKGTADKFRAELIENQVLSKGEKILALVGTPHAYTRYAQPEFQYNNDNFCAYDSNWLGNRLLQRYPGRVLSVLLHQPFPNRINQSPALLSPADGCIEALMAAMGNAPLGFDLAGTPVGELSDNSFFSMCYPGFRLKAFFDGYIFLAPFSALQSCTIDEAFVDEQNIATALKQAPDPDWHGRQQSLEEFRQLIRSMADTEKRYARIGVE